MVTQVPNVQLIPVQTVMPLQLPTPQQVMNFGGIDLVSLIAILMMFSMMGKVASGMEK